MKNETDHPISEPEPEPELNKQQQQQILDILQKTQEQLDKIIKEFDLCK